MKLEYTKFCNKCYHLKKINCEFITLLALLYTDVCTLEMRVINFFISQCKLKNKAFQKKKKRLEANMISSEIWPSLVEIFIIPVSRESANYSFKDAKVALGGRWEYERPY